MQIYWMFLAASLLVLFLSSRLYPPVAEEGSCFHYNDHNFLVIAFFALLIFFCGLRSGVADTGTYIYMFDMWPEELSAVDWKEAFNDKGFFFLTILYKQFISRDFQGWLFIIALVSGVSTMRALQKYSSDIGMSCFLFVAGTTFVYMINGMRQYIVISLMFASLDCIIERRFFRYCILVFLLSTIHSSAFLLLPFYLANRIKPFSLVFWGTIVGGTVFGVYLLSNPSILARMVEDTHYENYVDLLTVSTTGVNIYRLLISLVPCALCIVGKRYIQEEESPIINICVLAAFLTAVLYLVATISNGMVMGRILIYFEIYNLILLPWLIDNIFETSSAAFIKSLTVVFYTVFFYIQMVVTWNIGYESNLLHMFY